MSEDNRVRVFSNGFEYDSFVERNCEGCALSDLNRGLVRGLCAIEMALSVAYCDDGLLDPAIAARMGWTKGERRLGWPCPERSPFHPEVAKVETVPTDQALRRAGEPMLPGLEG